MCDEEICLCLEVVCDEKQVARQRSEQCVQCVVHCCRPGRGVWPDDAEASIADDALTHYRCNHCN